MGRHLLIENRQRFLDGDERVSFFNIRNEQKYLVLVRSKLSRQG